MLLKYIEDLSFFVILYVGICSIFRTIDISNYYLKSIIITLSSNSSLVWRFHLIPLSLKILLETKFLHLYLGIPFPGQKAWAYFSLVPCNIWDTYYSKVSSLANSLFWMLPRKITKLTFCLYIRLMYVII